MRFLYSTGWKSKSWTTVGVELKMQACWEKAMSVAELLRCVFLSSHSVSVCVCVCIECLVKGVPHLDIQMRQNYALNFFLYDL